MIPAVALLVLAAAAPLVPAAPPRTLTLDEALKTAGTRHPQLRQAAAATEAAEARSDEAFAPLLPQVAANGAYQRATANFTSRQGSLPSSVSSGSGAESWETFGYWSLGLNASVLVYDFGQTRNRWHSAQATVSAQRESERSALSQVRFSVRSSFFQARAAKGLVTVARETLSNQKKHLEQTEGFVEVGTQAEIALAQAKTAVANATVQLINAENGYDTARALLNQSMGVEGPTDYDVSDETQPEVAGEDESTETLLAGALEERPELSALASQVKAQELTVRAVEGAYGPSLGASTGLSDAGAHVGGLTWNWSSALTLSVPIFQGGQTKAQVREARANLAAVRSQLDAQRQQIRLEVEEARLAVRAAKGALGASAEALVNAREQLRLAEGRYETGVGSILELNDAQVALTAAGQQNVQAEYNLAQARAQLLRALGTD